MTNGSSAGLRMGPGVGPPLPAATTTAMPAFHTRSTARVRGSTAKSCFEAGRELTCARDQTGDERAMAVIVMAAVLIRAEVFAVDDGSGQVAHRVDAGVDDGDRRTGAVDAVGPSVVGSDGRGVHGAGGAGLGAPPGLELDGVIPADVADSTKG